MFVAQIFAAAVQFAAAQNASVDGAEHNAVSEIELPDVTTVVSGGTLTAGKDSVPDYTNILPENSAPSVKLPELKPGEPSFSVPEQDVPESAREKDIYAEGKFGAGYPFYFKGDFSVYRASGASPFDIGFSHESSEGFAGKNAEDGFFFRNTAIKGTKLFSGKNGMHVLSAEYGMSDDGLQLNSDSYSAMVKHTVSAAYESNWMLPNGLIFLLGADGSWYSRYGEIMKNSVTTGKFEDSSKVLALAPRFGFGWSGYGAQVMLDAFYHFQGNLEESDNLYAAAGSSSAESSHRGQLRLGASWTKSDETLRVFADGSVIFGTAVNAEDSRNIIPAFTVGAFVAADSFVPERSVTLSVSGGIDSHQEQIGVLGNAYRFAVAGCIPGETTDWFSALAVVLPVTPVVELSGECSFRKTAFGNGIWSPDYRSALAANGLYLIAQDERTELKTNIGMSVVFESVTLRAAWNAFWKDVPACEDEHSVVFSAEYQHPQAQWSVGASVAEALGDGADTCPNVSGWAKARLSPALSVALELTDVLKLFGRDSRDYAHSEYITASGSAALLLSFRF